jgi:hypothetical protein
MVNFTSQAPYPRRSPCIQWIGTWVGTSGCGCLAAADLRNKSPSPRVKRAGHEVHHSGAVLPLPWYSFIVWSSGIEYIFMEWHLVKHRNNITFYLSLMCSEIMEDRICINLCISFVCSPGIFAMFLLHSSVDFGLFVCNVQGSLKFEIINLSFFLCFISVSHQWDWSLSSS